MDTSKRIPLLAIALLGFAQTLPAQTRLVGEWLVHYERAVRNMHDSETRIVNETAKIALRVRGDSVFGYWQSLSSPGEQPPEPSTIRGVIHGDSVHVQLEPPPADGLLAEWGQDIVQFLKTYVHNMPPMTTYLDFVARGDSLIGTRRAATADGTRRVEPRLLTATRSRAP